jgi:hypothetical protein
MSLLSCTQSFPVPFTDFPIYIYNDNPEGTAAWLEIFPEAVVISTPENLITSTSQNLSNQGALVILSSTRTSLCRDLFLNIVSIGVKNSILRSYNGFFIDDYFNEYPLTTLILDVSPRLVFQTASTTNLPLLQRSYWISSIAVKTGLSFLSPTECLTFEGQFYPSLVVVNPPFPRILLPNFYFLFIVAIILLIGIIFWLICLVF